MPVIVPAPFGSIFQPNPLPARTIALWTDSIVAGLLVTTGAATTFCIGAERQPARITNDAPRNSTMLRRNMITPCRAKSLCSHAFAYEDTHPYGASAPRTFYAIPGVSKLQRPGDSCHPRKVWPIGREALRGDYCFGGAASAAAS
jgi:hypothetical protein